MKPRQDFERWAKGFSGCDGGNLNGSVWFCGIEWGTGKEHDLEIELRGSVSEPPQIYDNAEVNRQYPLNIKLMKLIASMQGGRVADYLRVVYQTPFPFHKDSDFFKLNLFPVAFRNVDPQLWVDKYKTATGLSTRAEYLEWCRMNRFPKIRSWVELGQPKLVVGVGRSFKADFQKAFGFNGAENEESIEGGKLVWMSNGKAILAVIPFLGYQQGSLNSNQLLQAYGERLGTLITHRHSG